MVGGGRKKKEIKSTKLVSLVYILHIVSYCKSISRPVVMYVHLRVLGVVGPFPFQRRENIPISICYCSLFLPSSVQLQLEGACFLCALLMKMIPGILRRPCILEL